MSKYKSDAFGNPLNVGDKVILTWKQAPYQIGTVDSFTPYNIRVKTIEPEFAGENDEHFVMAETIHTKQWRTLYKVTELEEQITKRGFSDKTETKVPVLHTDDYAGDMDYYIKNIEVVDFREFNKVREMIIEELKTNNVYEAGWFGSQSNWRVVYRSIEEFDKCNVIKFTPQSEVTVMEDNGVFDKGESIYEYLLEHLIDFEEDA